MSKLSIAACILFFEKVEQTIECIGSLLPSGITIYVLNNNSSQLARNTLGEYCSKHHQVKLFDSNVNLGIAVGRNYLISNTTEEWLFFVDNDITMKTPNWRQKLTSHICESEDIEVLIPKRFDAHDNRFAAPKMLILKGNKIAHSLLAGKVTNSFSGGASFISRKLFDRAGLYDDKMFIGFEDFEFSIRCMLSGNSVRAMIISDIELIHDHRRVMKNEDKKAVLTRYDMNINDKSLKRIAEKYPEFYFEQKLIPWAREKLKKMLPKEEIDLNMIDILNSFTWEMDIRIQRVIDTLLPTGSRRRMNVKRFFEKYWRNS